VKLQPLSPAAEPCRGDLGCVLPEHFPNRTGDNVKFEIASKAGCQRGREVLARFKSIIFRLASSFMPLEVGSLVRVGILSNVIGWLTT
jgi:hypothetical protein